jgi:hypothetical protein
MRKSNWTPLIVPPCDDQTVYVVLDDFGRNGSAYRVGFNTAKKWSQDVSGDVAHELRPAADGTTDFSVLQNQLRGKSDKIFLVAGFESASAYFAFVTFEQTRIRNQI